MEKEFKIKNHKFILKFKHEIIDNVRPEAELKDNGFSLEELKENLERINYWLGNVDQKAGILLAIEGVILTIICTSETITEIVKMINKGFTNFSSSSSDTWIAIFCILALLSTFISICILTHTISATIDPKEFKKKNPNLVTDSMLHFVTVGLRSYEKFRSEKQENQQKINDIRSQVYINSIICTKKFNSYKYALIAFRFMIFFITITLILTQI